MDQATSGGPWAADRSAARPRRSARSRSPAPRWQPSGRVIGGVWTILYPLIALAGVLLWRTPAARRDRGLLALFGLQWVLNALYPPLLTRKRSPDLATLDCGALAAAVWLLVGKAFPIRPLAGALLVPYALWTTFATALSLALRRRNA